MTYVSITLSEDQWRLIASHLVEQRIMLKDSNSPQIWIDNLKECIDKINSSLEPKGVVI